MSKYLRLGSLLERRLSQSPIIGESISKSLGKIRLPAILLIPSPMRRGIG